MLTGYTNNLPTDTLLSAGVLFCAKGGTYQRIGVTEGAPDFDPASDLGEIMFDNRAPSRLKGLSRVIGFQSLIKGTLKEFGPSASGAQIALIEPGIAETLLAPSAAALTPSTTGGTLVTNTYFYKITALNAAGESAGSAETSCSVTGPTGSVAVAWTAVTGATSYRVYRGTSASGENTFYTSATASLTDTGAAGTGGSPPSLNPTTTEAPKPAGAMFAASEYITEFRWIFERAGGGFACVYAPLVICRKWSMKGADKKEAQIAFEFEAVGDPVNDLSTAPYTIELRSSIAIQLPDGSNADVIATIGTSHIISFWDVATNTTLAASNTQVAQIDDVRGVGAGPSLVGEQDSGGSVWKPLYSPVTQSCRTNGASATGLITPRAGSSQYDLSQIRTLVMFGSVVSASPGSKVIGIQKASDITITAHLGGDFATPQSLDAFIDNVTAGGESHLWHSRWKTGSTAPRLFIFTLPQPTGANLSLQATPQATTEIAGRLRRMLIQAGPNTNTFTPIATSNGRVYFGGEPFGTNNWNAADVIFYGGLIVDKVLNRQEIAALERWAVRRGIGFDTTVPRGVVCLGDSRMYGNGAVNFNTDPVPIQLQGVLGANYDTDNRGVSGDNFDNAISANTLSTRFGNDKDSHRTYDWAVIWLGVNSFNDTTNYPSTGMTAATALLRLDVLIAAAKADGKKVLVCHETTQFPAGIPQAAAFNTGIDARLTSAAIDAVAALDQNSTLMDMNPAHGNSSDGLHYLPASMLIIAQIIGAAIVAAGG